MKTKYYKNIDLIRVVSLVSIFLYHLNILKGGYLAVCTFFVLSGYLSVITIFKKEKFSLKDYYINKIKKIYIPLLIVVCITIGVVSLIPNINWLNLKPESISVLLGYNNYWQLNANLDYFVRHISSPFMHLWYISILLQFELIFPIIFISLKKIGEKISKVLPYIILIILGVTSYLFFYKTVNAGNLMNAYYGTFARSFSLFFGVLLGFIHEYGHKLIFKRRILNKLIFYAYFLILTIMFILIDAKMEFFTISMLIVTLISMRLIDYATSSYENNTLNKIISPISKISYEVYLTQYPVIFIFQSINMIDIIKIPLIIVITFILSYLIHNSINFDKNSKFKTLRIILCFIIVLFTIFGFLKFLATRDHTAEMKKLEDDLNQNRLLIEQKQKEYQEKAKTEEDNWESILKSLDSDEKKIKEVVRNLNIVGIGDSIMELAVKDLYKEFPNGYFDAKVNRTEYEANKILLDLKNKGLLSDIIVFNLGTNGECSSKCREEIMATIGNRKLYWLNATNPDYNTFNPNLIEFAKVHKNIRIIDWISVVKGHPEYLISDKVHPTVTGCKVYAETIYNAIYEDYLKDFNNIKEAKIKEHEEKKKEKITFIGNDLLLGIYDYISKDYSDSNFIIDKKFTYKELVKRLNKETQDNNLSYNIVFMFDKSLKLTNREYDEIINLCKNHNIYLVDMNNAIKIDNDNVKIINFYDKLKNNSKYTSFDNIHLTKEGYIALEELIRDTLSK